MKYQILYCDPPWRYGCWYQSEKVKRNAADHYPVMSLQDLKRLPISKMMAEKSVCFMWITFPCLSEGLELLKTWGFRYSTVAFTWVKKNKKANSWFVGLGNYTRANAEICLLGIKGNNSLPRKSHSVRQICDARIMQHSQKPNEIRERIVELFGNLHRIELFARQRTPGWDAIGYDIDGKDIKDSLNDIIAKGGYADKGQADIASLGVI